MENECNEVPKYPRAIDVHSGVVTSSQILICGGGTREVSPLHSCYSLGKNSSKWDQATDMIYGRTEFGMATTIQGVVAIGGY